MFLKLTLRIRQTALDSRRNCIQSHLFFVVFGNEYVAKCWLHDTNLIFLEYCIPRMLLKLYS